jgi:P27 family predicted phage terminase small subunit
MPGRPPKSSKIHILEKEKVYGDLKDRIAAEPEQTDPNLEPECPASFCAEEKEIWEKCSDILIQYDLFNIANSIILELLVKNIYYYNVCVVDLRDMGMCITNNGKDVINPFWTMKNKCEDNIMKYLNLLGLSSMGLAKLGCLSVKSKREKSEMEKLLD